MRKLESFWKKGFLEPEKVKMTQIPITKKNIVIGKGYNRQALEGMLNFLESLYEDLLNDIRKGLTPKEAIESEIEEIKRLRKIWLD